MVKLDSLKKSSESMKSNEPTTLKMLLFSMGYFLNGFLIVAFGSFVWHYYESELGLIDITHLWPIYLAIANGIFTIFSMLINPIIGYLTDKPMKSTKKRGYHTPWVIIGGFPLSILFFLFFIPHNITGLESIFPILLYYLIIICLYDIFNSIYQTHSFGAFPAHFRGDKTRRKAGTITQIFIFIASFLAITLWSQIIVPGNSNSFTFAAFLSFLILFISLIIFIPGSKESEEIKDRYILAYETSEKKSFTTTMKMAIKQKNLMLVIFTYIFFMIALGLISMNTVNFIDDVLKESQTIRSTGSILTLFFSILTMPIWIRIAGKIGHSNTYLIGLFFLGCVLFLNLFVSNVSHYYIVVSLTGMASAMFTIMISPVLADCYDEFTVKTKKHHEATLIGVRNFFLRISITIQSVIVAFIHSFTYYNPNALNHDMKALFGLRIIQGLLPSLFCIIAAFIFYKWFDLKGKKKEEMIKRLNELGL
ncbi:MAG: MFS transporter [Promethearchaeota archaeon]